MNLRKKEMLDYRIYHETGRQVFLGEGQLQMDQQQLYVDELKIVDSLKFHLALNSVDDLITKEECNGAVGTPR